MTRKTQRRMTIIHSLDEIPRFTTEEEEHIFWSTHSFSAKLLSDATWAPDDPLAPLRQAKKQPPAKR